MTGKSTKAWLSDVGLSQYLSLFEENGIEFDSLGDLTTGHLKEIGVSMLGHRLRLMKAIATLKVASESAKASQLLAGVATAQRRQLTIMFCDLVGSTLLSARLDPEDYRDLLTLYQETVANVVASSGGHVAKYLGDGVLIYFGYPIAQEDAAERAIRVGLEIIQTVEVLVPAIDERLQMRIGVATGIVVAGDLIGRGMEEVSAVAGQTPNLAARLQELAEPGQIVIGDKTRTLVGEKFIYERLENVHLKGLETQKTAWRVISEAHSQESFTLAAGRERLSPLVGRDSERARLMAAWDAAKSGTGRVFLISGEAGIGKSRLSHEVVRQASDDRARVLSYQSAPYFTNTALYPIRHHIEHVLKFAEFGDHEARLDNMEKLVTAETDLTSARALMASFLSLPTDRYVPLNLSSTLLKSRTIGMLIDQVLNHSKHSPVLVYFEDLHWTDPTSLELLGRFIEALADHPILLLATHRPDFRHDWKGDRVEKCELSQLTTDQIEKLMASLTDGLGLSHLQLAKLLDRSGGVPLFAEELIRFVMGAGSDVDIDHAIPDSLQDILMARLDKLGANRELAQVGAAIGREFDIDLLSQVMETEPSHLNRSIAQIIDAHLVTPSKKDSSWTFQHALVQEAAYRSMLRRRRQNLHAKIAKALEDHFPERCQSGPEQVANHFIAGGFGARSVPYWLKAGKAAWANASAKEALAHLSKGLEFVDEVVPLKEKVKLELQLLSTIGVVHFAATSYGSPQAQAAFERSRELIEVVDDSDLRVAVLYGIGAFETMRGNVKKGHETFLALAVEADRSRDPRNEVYSNSMLAWSHLNRGNYITSIHHGERVIQLYEGGAMERPGPRLSAAEPKVISECMRSAALWSVGLPDQAVEAGQGIIEFARQLPDPYSLAYTLANGVIRVLGWTGDWDQVRTLTEECASVADDFGYGFLGVWASIWRARAMAHQGQLEEAEKMITASIQACKNAGVHYHRITFEANHARMLLTMGRVDEAATVLNGLDDALGKGGELNHEIELGLVKAELATVRGDTGKAQMHYRAAMASAEKRMALSWQLRGALGLAPLLENKEAQKKLIEPIFAKFSEGGSTDDLKVARTYL